MNSSHN